MSEESVATAIKGIMIDTANVSISEIKIEKINK
jgi:hypothetical protein